VSKRVVAITLAAVLVPVVAYDVHYLVNRGRVTEGTALAEEPDATSPPDAPAAPQTGPAAPGTEGERLEELVREVFPEAQPAGQGPQHWVDPFSAVRAQAERQPQPGPQQVQPAPAAPPPPDARLTGILECGRPLAIINGRVVGVGDLVDGNGWTVAKIERHGVVLTRGEQSHRLLLRDPGVTRGEE
jgi:hypothetical protein